MRSVGEELNKNADRTKGTSYLRSRVCVMVSAKSNISSRMLSGSEFICSRQIYCLGEKIGDRSVRINRIVRERSRKSAHEGRRESLIQFLLGAFLQRMYSLLINEDW